MLTTLATLLTIAVAAPTSFEGAAATNSIDFSADGSRLLAAGSTGQLHVFDTASGELSSVIPGADAFVVFAAFSPDDAQIAAVDYAGRLSIYDAGSGERLARQRGHDTETAGLDFGSGRLATSDKDGNVVVWSWTNGELSQLRRIDGAVGDFANQVVLSPDSKTVAACGSASREDGTGEVAIYDIDSGERVGRIVTPNYVNSLEYAPDGKLIYAGSAGGKVRGYNLATGGPAGASSGVGPQDLADVRTIANDISLVITQGNVTEVIAAGGDGRLRRADFNGNTRWTVRADEGACYYAALSPDGTIVATSGNDGKLRLFDADTGELRRTIAAD